MGLLFPQNTSRRRRDVPPLGAGHSLVDFWIFFLTASIFVLEKVLISISIRSLLSAHRNGNEINLFKREIIIKPVASNEISSVERRAWRDPTTPPSQPWPKKKKKFQSSSFAGNFEKRLPGRERRLYCSLWMVVGWDRRVLNALVRLGVCICSKGDKNNIIISRGGEVGTF